MRFQLSRRALAAMMMAAMILAPVPPVLTFAQPIVVPTSAPTTARADGAAGEYLGTITYGTSLRLGLSLEGPDSKLKGKLNSIDQSAIIPIDSAKLVVKKLVLTLKGIGASFEGTMSDDKQTIAGTWTQNGVNLPLTFKRTMEMPTLHRPQDPKRPYPYNEQEVVIDNRAAGVKLGGTLTLPKRTSTQPSHSLPAVLLITGSGAQDRDESLLGHRPFLIIADHLTRAGIAVLRLDDRGVGKSTGDFVKATETDFVSDAKVAIDYLRHHPDIDPKRVGVLGHSEGGIIGPKLAADDPQIAFVVMVAGPGIPMDELLLQQSREVAMVLGEDAASIARNQDAVRETFAILKQTSDPPDLEQKLRSINERELAALPADQRQAFGGKDRIDAQIKMITSPWFRELLRYDPAPTLAKLKCPVLAIGGEKDLQVAAKENLAGIKRANPSIETHSMPGLNHLLQHCKTGSPAEYSTIEETMSPEVLKMVGDWIKSHSNGH
ncbi:MAG TPA: alpha/beta fold hydrolase [Tepidisphaeraceae bacterium]|nr:alpha/beta fold hydrolase [Tepidisphaeraceae bacterium]